METSKQGTKKRIIKFISCFDQEDDKGKQRVEFQKDMSQSDEKLLDSRLIELCGEISKKIRETGVRSHGDTIDDDDDCPWNDESIVNEMQDLVQGLAEMNESIKELESSYTKLTARCHEVTKDVNTLKQKLRRLRNQQNGSDTTSSDQDST